MSLSSAAAPAAPARALGSGGGATGCPGVDVDGSADAWTVFTELFPPRDADGTMHREWLARSRWPEVVFASAR
jgi:hypothetical protein